MKKLLIQKYFEDTLSDEESVQFNTLMHSDEAFKKAVDFEMDFQKALRSKQKDTLRDTFRRYEKEKSTNTKSPISFFWKIAVAATLTLSLGILGFHYFQKATSTDALFAANFEPYRNIIAPITRNADTLTSKELAFQHYEKGEYQTALNEFKILYASDGASYYLFYLGNIELQLKQTKAAINTFEKHLALNDDFSEKSRWYLALAHLLNGTTTEAKSLLHIIATDQSFQHKKAIEILKEL